MEEPIPSYEGKMFMIEDNVSLIRNPNNLGQTSRYKAGDTIPPGKKVGDRKLIPLMTKIKVTGVRTPPESSWAERAEPDAGSSSRTMRKPP